MRYVSDFEYLFIETKLMECKQSIENILKEHHIIKIVRMEPGNRFYFANRCGVALRIKYSSQFKYMRILDVNRDDEEDGDVLRICFKELKTEKYWNDIEETYYNAFCRILEEVLKLPVEIRY